MHQGIPLFLFSSEMFNVSHAGRLPQHPCQESAPNAKNLLEIHLSIPAVAKTTQAPLHHPVPVCYGGIAREVAKSIMVDALRSMQATYLHQIHPKIQES